jgi:hypothetical protein
VLGRYKLGKKKEKEKRDAILQFALVCDTVNVSAKFLACISAAE